MLSEYPDYTSLLKVKNLDLELICDVKTFDDDDMILVRLNHDKVVAFLKHKHTKVSQMLMHHAKQNGFSVHACGFVVDPKSSNDTLMSNISKLLL